MNVSSAVFAKPAPMPALGKYVRDIPDFPKPGVVFKDITPLLADPGAFAICIDALCSPWRARRIDAVLGIESRGFIFGAAVAHALDAGFVPLRKAGKLPSKTIGVDYELEYAVARLEAHVDALEPGARVLIVDDVLATGGTAKAVAQLVELVGGNVVGLAFVIELTFLNGRQRLDGYDLYSLIKYQS